MPLRPCSSDDHLASVSSVRAPPVKFTCRQFTRPRAFSSDPAPKLAFGDGDDNWDLWSARLGQLWRDVGKLKKLQGVQPPLAFRDVAEPILGAFPNGQLPPDDVLSHRGIAFNGNAAEHRRRPGISLEYDLNAVLGRSRSLDRLHGCIRKPVIPQLTERQIVRGQNQRLISRLARLHGDRRFQSRPMPGGNPVHCLQANRFHDDGLTLSDVDRDADLVLCVVELHVDVGNFRVGIAMIGVVGLDALHVALELRTIEIVRLGKRQNAVLLSRDHFLERFRRNRAVAFEGDRGHLNRAGFAAGGKTEHCQSKKQRAKSRHPAASYFLPSALCPLLSALTSGFHCFTPHDAPS